MSERERERKKFVVIENRMKKRKKKKIERRVCGIFNLYGNDREAGAAPTQGRRI